MIESRIVKVESDGKAQDAIPRGCHVFQVVPGGPTPGGYPVVFQANDGRPFTLASGAPQRFAKPFPGARIVSAPAGSRTYLVRWGDAVGDDFDEAQEGSRFVCSPLGANALAVSQADPFDITSAVITPASCASKLIVGLVGTSEDGGSVQVFEWVGAAWYARPEVLEAPLGSRVYELEVSGAPLYFKADVAGIGMRIDEVEEIG